LQEKNQSRVGISRALNNVGILSLYRLGEYFSLFLFWRQIKETFTAKRERERELLCTFAIYSFFLSLVHAASLPLRCIHESRQKAVGMGSGGEGTVESSGNSMCLPRIVRYLYNMGVYWFYGNFEIRMIVFFSLFFSSL
jgi:hypothetical protein